MAEETRTALITGGEGDLAQVVAECLRVSGMRALTPSRGELDVGSPASVKSYGTTVGNVDLLVCNAGVTTDKPLARMTESDWDNVMQVNLRGAFLCAREVSRGMMKRRSGHIVFVSSFSALHPPVGQVNYAAAKAGLLGVMKSMAKELGSRNVRVNAILPGFLETKMTRDLSDDVKEKVKNRHVLGRFNTPDEVGKFITFLHQQMPHTSGQVFNLDSRVL